MTETSNDDRVAVVPLAAPAAPFVGRATELASLEQALAEAVRGSARVHLVGGEPGIGKTRIISELARNARGATVLWGRCHAGAGAPAFWPWAQVLDAYIRRQADGSAHTLGDSGAQSLAQLLGVHEPRAELAESVDPEQARFALFLGMARFLARVAAAEPLLLILDDMHWADEPSLLLLEFIARELRDERVCIVVAHRDELQPGAPLTRVVTRLSAEPQVRTLHLRGIERADVGRCLAALLGGEPPEGVVDAVTRRTEGNPFFITQIARQLAGRPQAGSYEAWVEEIPATVREMIAGRLARLSPSSREVVAVAAVIGRTASAATLARTAGLPEPRVIDGLAEAVRANILGPVPGARGVYRFVHTLLRETVLDELPAADAVQLHRRLVAAYEPQAGERGGAPLDEVAEHAWEAARSGELEDLVAAVDWCSRAGERATGQLAFETAARLYERAIEAAGRLREETGRRVELQLLLGEAQSRSGDMATGQATLLRAAAVAREAGRPDLVARAALTYRIGGLAGFAFDDPDPGLRALIEEALDLLGPEDSPVRARLLARLATELHFSEEAERRSDLSAEAVAMARRLGDPRLLAEALGARHIAHWRPEDVEEQLAAATEVCRIARSIGDRELELQGEYWRLCDLLELADAVAVDESLEAVARLAADLDQPLYSWWVTSRRSMRLLLAGSYAEAAQAMEEQLNQGIRIKRGNAVQIYGGQLLLLRIEQGRGAEMLPAIETLCHAFPRDPTWRLAHAWLLTHDGRLEEASRALDLIAAAGYPLGFGFTRMICMALLCELSAAVGAREHAAAAHAMLEPFAERAVTAGTATVCFGPAALSLARASAVLGRWDRAERELQVAIRVAESLRSRPYVAHASFELASVLAARDAPGDAADALLRAQAAIAIARVVGMPALLGRAERLLAGLRERAGAASGSRRPGGGGGGWAALTQREREVVRLAAQGLPARGIGERLFIGKRTVETHLANAYGKLGVSSRTELLRAGLPADL